MGWNVYSLVIRSGEEVAMKRALVFPGQGSQYVGMGKDLYEGNSDARKIFERADEVLGFSLSKLCFDGSDEELKQTQNTQPALFVHSLAVFAMLKQYAFDMVAGHSLGEYTALVVAGALSFEDGLKLVRLRGELMQKAGVENPGTMAAIIGLESELVKKLCEEAQIAGIVQPANFNSPGQIVISGSVSGVRKAMELAKEHGAKMAKELSVSGAFHSPLMEPAVKGLEQGLRNVTIHDARVPVYSNVTALPITSAQEIRSALVRQLTNSVRWEESVRNMIVDGATEFVEIGAGKVLQGLIKRINSNVAVHGIEKLSDVELMNSK